MAMLLFTAASRIHVIPIQIERCFFFRPVLPDDREGDRDIIETGLFPDLQVVERALPDTVSSQLPFGT